MLDSLNFKSLDNSKKYYIEPLNIVGYVSPMMSYDPYLNEYYYSLLGKINNESYSIACLEEEFYIEEDANFDELFDELKNDKELFQKKIEKALSSIELYHSDKFNCNFLSMNKAIKASTKEEYLCCNKVMGQDNLCYLIKKEDLVKLDIDDLDSLDELLENNESAN